MRSGFTFGILGLTMAGVAMGQYPFGLPYFIPCDGPWANGNKCPNDSYCWNISFESWAGKDWALCRPESMRTVPSGGTSGNPPPATQASSTLSLVSFFGTRDCGGDPATFNITGPGGFEKGGCVKLDTSYPSILVSQLGRGCAVTAYTDKECKETPVEVQPVACLTLGEGNWGSFSTDKCA